MSTHTKRLTRTGIATAVIALVSTALATAAPAAPKVRGFDGSTVTVASNGTAKQFPNTPIGVQARIKRFNDTNEIKGVQIKWSEFANDDQDPATALNEVRRLVTQTGVFALVGDVSQVNPTDYLKQQQVPYFGWAFDNGYCSPQPNETLWGFGWNGCLVPANPSVMPDNGRPSYSYVSETLGKKHPTLSIFTSDTLSGKNSAKYQASSYQGAGYDVVYLQAKIPTPPVSDYTPYVQDLLQSDDGKAPDAMLCLMSTDCIPMFSQLQASGFQGVFISSLYSDLLVKAMNGSAVNVGFNNLTEDTPGINQMKKDIEAFQPGASSKIDSGVVAGYTSTDMFIQALKTAAKKGKSNITPAAVQKAAMHQTWEIKGLAGPTEYPKATAASYQSCGAELVSDGTAWKTVTPYACSKKQWKIDPKFG